MTQTTDLYDGYDEVGNAEENFQYMHELQNAGFNVAAPDTVTYSKVIGSYTRVSNQVNKGDPIKSEKVLRDIIHLCNNGSTLIATDHMSYNKFVIAWMKTKQTNSTQWSYW